ncbi:MAG: hypothetical protein PUB10_07145 [Clostridiales bacterium]|nr:hypothetical protein [Clostridiales bacterium]
MKYGKKILCLALFLFSGIFLLTGCFEPHKDAAETIQILYKLVINQDTKTAEDFGIPSSVTETFKDAYKETCYQQLKNGFETNGFSIDDETLRNIVNARCDMYSKLECTTSISSKSKKTVSVTIETQYYDETAIMNKALEKTMRKAMDENIMHMSGSQLKRKMGEFYTEYLIKGYENAKPEEETRTIFVSCSKQHFLWLPSNLEDFITLLINTVSGL